MKNDEIGIDTLVDMAKERMNETGEEHELTFFVPQFDQGRMAVMQAEVGSVEQKDQVAEELRNLIEELDADEYYSVFTAWMVAVEKQQEKFKQMVKELSETDESERKGKLAKMLIQFAKNTTLSPSQHPDRQSILAVSKYSKKEGTDVVVIPYEIVDDGFEFHESNIMEKPERIYTRWNVWKQEQINLNVPFEKAMQAAADKKGLQGTKWEIDRDE